MKKWNYALLFFVLFLFVIYSFIYLESCRATTSSLATCAFGTHRVVIGSQFSEPYWTIWGIGLLRWLSPKDKYFSNSKPFGVCKLVKDKIHRTVRKKAQLLSYLLYHSYQATRKAKMGFLLSLTNHAWCENLVENFIFLIHEVLRRNYHRDLRSSWVSANPACPVHSAWWFLGNGRGPKVVTVQ